jgi:hypothetical protein
MITALIPTKVMLLTIVSLYSNMNFTKFLILLGVVFTASNSYAHHSKNFIQLSSTSITPPKHIEFSLFNEYRDEVNSKYKFDPALGYGINKFIAGEIHFHLEKENGNSLEMKGYAFEMQVLSPKNYLGLNWAGLIEIAHVDTIKTISNQVNLFPKARFHTGHNLNVISNSFIIEKETIGTLQLISSKTIQQNHFTLQLSKEINGSNNKLYGIGYRRLISHDLSFSIESIGPLGNKHGHEIWFAYQTNNLFPFQMGYGKGIGAKADLNAFAFMVGFML